MQHTDTLQFIKNFFRSKETITYTKGNIILDGTQDSKWGYYIEEGYVKVYSLTPTGEEHIHFIYKKNNIFPLYVIFNDTPQDIYYEALTTVTVKRVLRKHLIDFFMDDAHVTLYITQQIITTIVYFFHRMDTLEMTSSYNRVISYLLFLSKTLGKEHQGNIFFDVPLTQEDIANSVNVTRETANKELNNLARKNLISKRKSTIVITNISRLQEELM